MDIVNDEKWVKSEFIPRVQKRGAEIIAVPLGRLVTYLYLLCLRCLRCLLSAVPAVPAVATGPGVRHVSAATMCILHLLY